MHTNEMQIGVDQLKIGMFVSKLDRPWLDTPFLIQGFKITSLAEIDQLRNHCHFVFIDVEQGIRPAARPTVIPSKPVFIPQQNEYQKLRKRVYDKTSDFDEELPKAEAIHQDLSKNISKVMADLRDDKQLDLASLKRDVDALLGSIIRNPTAFMWVSRLKKSDNYAYRHLIGTAIWCGIFGRHLGLDRGELEALTLGGLLIDVGKVKIPQAILSKNARLTEEEFKVVKTHVDHGVRFLAKSRNIPSQVTRIVATHHERWDGSGYPMRLKGIDIPIFGRIVGLIDSYEAMTTDRVFATGMSPHRAISELYELRGTVFQAELVEQFIQASGVYPTGSLVELNNGSVAVVVAMNGTRRLRPKLMLLLDNKKRYLKEFETLDLSAGHEELSVTRGLPPGAFGINMEELFL